MTPIKIGFVLLSNSRNPIPSTRITVLNMLPFLREANFDPHIVFEPELGSETPELGNLAPRLISEGFQIVYFQKVHGESAERNARKLSASGIKTVYGVCDLVDEGMATATDATITVTDYLKSLYPQLLQSKISVVHDGIEHPEKFKINFISRRGSRARPLHAVLVTSADLDKLPVLHSTPGWLNVSIVGRYPPAEQVMQRLRTARWQFLGKQTASERIDYLRFLVNQRIQRIAWDPVGVYKMMQQADIGIIPIETQLEDESIKSPPVWKVKSENRLTMKMCVGLPVIATPIPSYLPVIDQGRNGFLASTRHEWLEYLDVLRDPKLRQDIGENARQSVFEKYSSVEQAKLMIHVLRELVEPKFAQ